MARAPLIRVIVVNWNGGDLTLECVEHLERTQWPPDRFQIVVVDNASTDGVVGRLRADHPGVEIIETGGNLGFAGACNGGLSDLDGVDYIALVNNDATVEPGWLRPLVDEMDGDERVGAVNSKVLLAGSWALAEVPASAHLISVVVDGRDITGSIERDNTRLAVPLTGTKVPHAELHLIDRGAERRFEAKLDAPGVDLLNSAGGQVRPGWFGADRGYLWPDDGAFDEPSDIDTWTGAAVLLRRAYLEDVGLFDERFFLYYEDFDLAWRGHRKGWRYRYAPTSVVRHRRGSSSRTVGSRFEFWNERNRLLAIAKNAPWPEVVRAVGNHTVTVLGSLRRADIRSARTRVTALASFVRLLPGSIRRRRRTG